MASISNDPGGHLRILFTGVDGKRKAIRLGKVPKKIAESIKLKVEALVSAAAAKLPTDLETATWINAISNELAAKLAGVGLIPERPKAVTVGGLLALYGSEREADNKPGTRTNHRTITNDLVGHFGENADPRAITTADAKRFLDHLRGRELAAATVARRLRRTRSIFAFAVKRGLITTNPFADLKAVSVLPAERKAYVTVSDAERLMAAANPLWRTIIALCRYAGLRCPSEVLLLRWADIDFASGRMTVTSPKTEGIPGKEYRVCPIFTALRPYLEDAFDLAEEGAVYVIGGAQGDRYRATAQGPNGWVNCNLRTEFTRIIRRAGLKGWPRLFHTLRASCETDLLEQFPINAVTEWLGHSAAVALKHYARVPDHLFERASRTECTKPPCSTGDVPDHQAGSEAVVGGATSGAPVAQKAARTGADTKRPERTDQRETLLVKAIPSALSAPVRSSPDDQMTLRGFEPRSLP